MSQSALNGESIGKAHSGLGTDRRELEISWKRVRLGEYCTIGVTHALWLMLVRINSPVVHVHLPDNFALCYILRTLGEKELPQISH
jgi:hypothetical protein